MTKGPAGPQKALCGHKNKDSLCFFNCLGLTVLGQLKETRYKESGMCLLLPKIRALEITASFETTNIAVAQRRNLCGRFAQVTAWTLFSAFKKLEE